MKSRGFTLIELLAVIVILAIIALIAVPIVLNIIKDSKESATIRSKEIYIEAVNLAVTRAMMDPSFPQGKVVCEMLGNPPSINLPDNYDSTKYDEDDILCYQIGSNIGEIVRVDIKGDVPIKGTIKFLDGKINLNRTSLTMSDGKTYRYDANNNLIILNSSENLPDYYGWQYGNIDGELYGASSDLSTANFGDNLYYFGFDSLDDKTIDAAYVCFKRESNGKQYCLKGGDSDAYSNNVNIIREAFADIVDTNACYFDDNVSRCQPNYLNVNVEVRSNGYVEAGNANAYCKIYDFGSFGCD